MIIVYIGLRNFYIKNHPLYLTHSLILTNQDQTWDVSPGLHRQDPTKNQPRVLKKQFPEAHLEDISIRMPHYQRCRAKWIAFCSQWTDHIETEHPHSWFCRFSAPFDTSEHTCTFINQLRQQLQTENLDCIWGAGVTKTIAKYAAHVIRDPANKNAFVSAEETAAFLKSLPVQHVPQLDAEACSKLGLQTLGDLLQVPTDLLHYHFGAQTIQQIGSWFQDKEATLRPASNQAFHWTRDFVSDPQIQEAITVSNQLQPFLHEGSTSLAYQLKSVSKAARLLVLKLICQTRAGSIKLKNERCLNQATSDPHTIQRIYQSILPVTQEPIIKLQLQAAQLENQQPQQLQLLDAHPTAAAKRSPASIVFSPALKQGISLSRREKIVAFWETHCVEFP